MSFNFLKCSKKTYFSYPCPRKLKDLVKLSLFEREQPAKIKEIWKQYYDNKPSSFGMDMEAAEMDLIIKNGQTNKFFIFPVRKATGYYVLVVQNQDKSFVYTFLDDYKNNPNNATPFLVMTMYDELVFKKAVGLVRGDIIGDLTKRESEILFTMTRRYFTNDSLYQNVVTFNRNSDKFNYQEHINNCLNFYDTDAIKV